MENVIFSHHEASNEHITTEKASYLLHKIRRLVHMSSISTWLVVQPIFLMWKPNATIPSANHWGMVYGRMLVGFTS
jgi:hypothetical protein